MARSVRLDSPGAIQHVMIRGIDRRRIFRDDRDREDFARRLDRLVPKLGFRCFAWALMPNHAHLALQTGPVGLSRLMARIGTGYVRTFNLRYRRAGHLMQNRFKSRLVADEGDLAGLVLYIHANPLRAGLVRETGSLEAFPWCGHGSLVGRRPARPFEAFAPTLALFADDPKLARERIRRRIQDAGGADPRWSGALHSGEPETGQDPMHGLRTDALPSPSAELTPSLDGLITEVCEKLTAHEGQVRAGRRGRAFAAARAEIAYRAICTWGEPVPRVAAALGVTPSGISRAIARAWRQARVSGDVP